jgi:hypothetical protein
LALFAPRGGAALVFEKKSRVRCDVSRRGQI